jgi:beta-glucanase (GH16 family)
MSRNFGRFRLLSTFSTVLLAGTFAQAQTAKPGWELTFDDEFTGANVDATKWQKRYKWGEAQINGELQAYVDDAYQLDGSVLHIVGQHSTGQYAGQTFEYRSGLIASIFHQKYGWFETRCRMPLGQGLWPAFWLLGENGTTGVNEIDIHEYLGSVPNTVYMTVHWGTSYTTGHQSDSQSYSGPDFSADYHTFALDWDADRVIWYVDGIERFRHTGAGVPQVEMYVIANLAIGGTWPGAPDAATVFPANYDIDYIRVYGRLQDTGDAGNTEPADAANLQNDAGDRGDGGTGGQSGNKPSTKISGSGAANGCGCHLVGQKPNHSTLQWTLLLALGGIFRRRRRRSPQL